MNNKDLVVGHSEGVKYKIGDIVNMSLIDTVTNEKILNIDGTISSSQTNYQTPRNFTIQKVYDIDDLDHNGDLMEVRLYDEKMNQIMNGDYYHNKIEDKIKGFFEALDYLKIEYKCITEKLNEEF